MPLSYVLAALVLVPGLLSKVELATAMPRAGGIYYFLDRSMGPLVGTIGGFGTWIALILKSAFALIGVGAYLRLFVPGVEMGPIAAALAVAFGVVNHLGAKRSGSFQVLLLVGLVILLLWFCGLGVLHTEMGSFAGFFESDGASVISTAGLVVVSYMGLTKVASVAEEVRNPDRDLPLGMFLAFVTILLIYVVGTSVMIGVVGVERLAANGGDLTPVATVAEALVGRWGAVVMTVGAVLAFASVANAGVMSASRYPLAMGRDHLLPPFFGRIGARGTPTVGIVLTVGLILVAVLSFDPTKIAKLAGAFKLVMFALACLAVIVMRESRIDSYDPGYRAPLYPGIQIVGILLPFWLIVNMGLLPTLFTGGLITFGAMWFTYYARDRVSREGAIFHVFERWGRQRDAGLDRELRGIMKERSARDEGRFEEVLTDARVIDVVGHIAFEELARRASRELALDLPVSMSRLLRGFLEGTRTGVTPVSHGAALPHLRFPAVARPHMVVARARHGIRMAGELDEELGRDPEEPVRGVFFLVSPADDPAAHLRTLAQIARAVDREGFMEEWLAAEGEDELREALFRDERLLALRLDSGGGGAGLVGLALRDVSLADGTLIAMIRRGDEIVIPRGDTVLRDGDRLTVIGSPEGIRAVREAHSI